MGVKIERLFGKIFDVPLRARIGLNQPITAGVLFTFPFRTAVRKKPEANRFKRSYEPPMY